MKIMLTALPDSDVMKGMNVMVPVKEDVVMMAHGLIQYPHVIVSNEVSKLRFLLI